MSKDSDSERLQRLRDAQIRARDPGASKIKGYDWSNHARRSKQVQKSRHKPLLVELYSVLPGRWKGLLNGGIVGLVVAIILGVILPPDWRLLVLVPLLICMIIGFVIGSLIAGQHAP